MVLRMRAEDLQYSRVVAADRFEAVRSLRKFGPCSTFDLWWIALSTWKGLIQIEALAKWGKQPVSSPCAKLFS